jgi:hypothetical protein
MQDAAGTTLEPDDYVCDDRGRLYRVRESGTVYRYGHWIGCQPLRRCGATWAEHGAETWPPVQMVFKVQADELDGDLAAAWHAKIALLRPAMRARLGERRMRRR